MSNGYTITNLIMLRACEPKVKNQGFQTFRVCRETDIPPNVERRS